MYVTKQTDQDYDSSGQTGAITPAMIEAGVMEYWEHDVEEEGSAAVLSDVFLTMARVGGWHASGEHIHHAFDARDRGAQKPNHR